MEEKKSERQNQYGETANTAEEIKTSAPEPAERKEAANDAQSVDKEIEALLNGDAKKEGGARPKKKKRGKRILFFVILLVAAAILFKVFGMQKPSLPMPETGVLSRGTITETLTVTGPVEGTDSVDVTSNLHAKITELNVKEGDRVEAGSTVLAKLDTTDLLKEVEIARGNYELAVAQKDEKIKSDTESYRKALSELQAAEANYNRKAALANTGDIPQVELETALNELNDARRAVSAFTVKDGKVAADESMDIQIKNAKLALEQTKGKIDDATIIAPIGGTVTRVNTKVGQFADAIEDNKPMITIENLDELQMEIKISEYSIGKVELGQPVIITADILGEGNAVNGEIISISPTGEEKGGGSSERVIPTKVRILDEDTALIAGITAKAQIVLEEAEDAFAVPISAIGDDGSEQAVMQFVRTDAETGKSYIRLLPVKTGIESDISVEIREIADGAADEAAAYLKEGARYLTTYLASGYDGMEIRVSAESGDADA